MKQIVWRVTLFIALLLCVQSIVSAQVNIVGGEYFFDSDPGYGNGTAITVGTPSSNIGSLLVNATTSSLTNGLHTLYIRTKDANGKWSMTNELQFAKVQPLSGNPYTAGTINKMEYFYDTDPGFGNGTDIPVTASANLSNLLVNVNVSSLSDGLHTLYIRSRDAQGRWSISGLLYFAKIKALSGNPYTASTINKMEYFYDTDPGFGNGTDIPVTASATISNMVVNVGVSGLATGVHTLYIRSRDAQGKWSMSGTLQFAKVQSLWGNPYTAGTINKMEYFYDTDPGIGNGVDIPVTAANDINGLVINTNVSSLNSGLHTLYIRSRDAQGKWSLTNSLVFTKIQLLSGNPYTISKINKLEYFYDTDPGFGNGTDVPVTPGTDLSNLVFNANVAALANGVHTLYLRSRDSLGQWSMSNTLQFVKIQALLGNPYSLTNITGAEYYFDTDPGFGNGTAIPGLSGATNFTNTNFNANVSTLPNGVHTLYVRTKDAQGKWSITQELVFAKVQPLSPNPHSVSNIVAVEYFIDTDPGFGNGISVPVTPATNLPTIGFNVDMTVLANTAHHLYVRTKDAQGKWSITNVHSFNGGLIPLAMKLISFEARVADEHNVHLEWITEQEVNVSHYTIERSYDASKWVWIGEQKPANNTGPGRKTYRLIDEEPGSGIIYYRLTEHDLSGKKTIAPIRFVTLNTHETTPASLFPNPNDGKQVTISSGIFQDGEVEISIITTDGKLYLRQKTNTGGNTHLTLSDLNLPVAVYFINLRSATQSQSFKLQVVSDDL